MREEAKGPQTIIKRNHDNAAERERVACVKRRARAAVEESAAVDPNHDRERRVMRARRRPNVQIKTVLAHGLRRGIFGISARLHAYRRELVAVPDPGPLRGRRGRAPAKRAKWRRRERDALEHAHTIRFNAFNETRDSPDRLRRCHWREVCGRRCNKGEQQTQFSDYLPVRGVHGRPLVSRAGPRVVRPYLERAPSPGEMPFQHGCDALRAWRAQRRLSARA